jgi:hypothetical protein
VFPNYPLSNQILAHSFALFFNHKKFNSFIFKRFPTLRQETIGGPLEKQTAGENGRRLDKSALPAGGRF